MRESMCTPRNNCFQKIQIPLDPSNKIEKIGPRLLVMHATSFLPDLSLRCFWDIYSLRSWSVLVLNSSLEFLSGFGSVPAIICSTQTFTVFHHYFAAFEQGDWNRKAPIHLCFSPPPLCYPPPITGQDVSSPLWMLSPSVSLPKSPAKILTPIDVTPMSVTPPSSPRVVPLSPARWCTAAAKYLAFVAKSLPWVLRKFSAQLAEL